MADPLPWQYVKSVNGHLGGIHTFGRYVEKNKPVSRWVRSIRDYRTNPG